MDVAASGALELRIAPSNGLPSDPLACTETSDGFGCTRDLNGVVAQYKFTTESDASSRPYRVYILNRGSTDLHSSFEVRLDNQDRINHPVIVKANQIMEVARIYRNSVVDLSGS